MPSHLGVNTGGLNLNAPTGGLTCLIPLNAKTLLPERDSSTVPHRFPSFVWATGNSHFFPTFISPSSLSLVSSSTIAFGWSARLSSLSLLKVGSVP